jgi:hypothetical protein
MTGLFQTWWAAVSGYFITAASLASGDVTTLPLLAAAGLVALVIGVVLLVAWRVKRIGMLWWLVVATLLTPIVIFAANSILGWLGMLFAVLGGAVVLLVGTTVTANNAERRLPVWLVGLFLIDFAFFAAYLGNAFVSLAV